MIKYFLVRYMFILPTMLSVCLMAFVLNEFTPGDITSFKTSSEDFSGLSESLNKIYDTEEYLREKFNLYQPLFYFGVESAAVPKKIHSFKSPIKKQAIRNWALIYGNPSLVWHFYKEVEKIEKDDFALAYTVYNAQKQEDLEETVFSHIYENKYPDIRLAFTKMCTEKKNYLPFVPTIHFHGKDNRFHIWAVAALRGSLGTSYKDSKPVVEKVTGALLISLAYTLPSFLIIWTTGILLGFYLSSASSFTILKGFLYILDAIPLFWLALLLILMFSSGVWLNIFPVYGLGSSHHQNYVEMIAEKIYHLFLPITALVLSCISYVSSQIARNLQKTKKEGFVQTAFAKGFSHNYVTRKHIFPNSQIPILSIFWVNFGIVFGGALTIEIIFSLPGLGMLLINSVYSRDLPVVIGIMLFTAFIKITCMLLADISYYLSDPRIKYASGN